MRNIIFNQYLYYRIDTTQCSLINALFNLSNCKIIALFLSLFQLFLSWLNYVSWLTCVDIKYRPFRRTFHYFISSMTPADIFHGGIYTVDLSTMYFLISRSAFTDVSVIFERAQSEHLFVVQIMIQSCTNIQIVFIREIWKNTWHFKHIVFLRCRKIIKRLLSEEWMLLRYSITICINMYYYHTQIIIRDLHKVLKMKINNDLTQF